MDRKLRTVASMLLIAMISFSCGNNSSSSQADEENPGETEEVIEETPIDEMTQFRFDYTIANLPAPMEVLSELSQSGLDVNISLLNPVENAENYRTSYKQAMNYGIYGVDLAYAVFNERNTEIFKYYPVVRDLSEELDLSQTFDKFTDQFEAFQEGNASELEQVVDDLYAATDEYLRNNERLATASEILAGSWLEAQYLTVSALLDADKNTKNEKLYTRIWEQRLYLDNITKLVGEFSSDESLSGLKEQFNGLLTLYKTASDETQVDKAYLESLLKSISNVRNTIIG